MDRERHPRRGGYRVGTTVVSTSSDNTRIGRMDPLIPVLLYYTVALTQIT